MKLYLIRHGESLDDIEDRFGGFANYPLTDNGREKVTELAEELKGAGIQKLLTSPYLRAYDAATIIAKSTGTELTVDMDVRERNTYGYLSGMRKSLAQQHFPEDYQNSRNQKTADEIDGSEKYLEVIGRAECFFEKLRGLDEKVVGVVSHGKFMDIFQREVLKLDQTYKLSDCGYIVIDLENVVIEQANNAKIVE